MAESVPTQSSEHPTWDFVQTIEKGEKYEWKYEGKQYTGEIVGTFSSQATNVLTIGLARGAYDGIEVKDVMSDGVEKPLWELKSFLGDNIAEQNGNAVFYLNRITDFKELQTSEILEGISETNLNHCLTTSEEITYEFGDGTLQQDNLVTDITTDTKIMANMVALHKELSKKFTDNKKITKPQCRTLVEQIMNIKSDHPETDITVLCNYLVKLPVGIFTKNAGDILYTYDKQKEYIDAIIINDMPKQALAGRASRIAEQEKKRMKEQYDKALYAKGPEVIDGSIILALKPENDNIIILKPDGSIVIAYPSTIAAKLGMSGMTLSSTQVKDEIKKNTDGSIDKIVFKSTAANMLGYGSSVKTPSTNSTQKSRFSFPSMPSMPSMFTRKPAPAAGGRRTRRKSNKSSTRKSGQRGGGRCRDACKKVSKASKKRK